LSKTLLLSEYHSEATVNQHFFTNSPSVIDFSAAAAISLAV
jgi:hypothetical protein